jgi:hypothetical protein
MTTTVVISSPAPNHQDVEVFGRYVDQDGNDYGDLVPIATLAEGQSATAYIHSGLRLVIVEKPKLLPAPTA